VASLMENLIAILEDENSEYEILLELSKKKTPVIIKGDLGMLQKITDEEQIVVSRINQLERKREESIHDIANVINKDVKTLKLVNIIQMLEKRPDEQKKLSRVHDKLSRTVSNMARINEQNRELIKNALEMVNFDLNLVQAMRTAPETANYNRGAYNTGSVMGKANGYFDAKQ